VAVRPRARGRATHACCWEWMRFLDEHDVELFDSRARLKGALGRYAEHRATGPVEQRFAATTWGRHMSVLSVFYRWAIAENYATAQPFTYRTARAHFRIEATGGGVESLQHAPHAVLPSEDPDRHPVLDQLTASQS
jgi:hypothetical protein